MTHVLTITHNEAICTCGFRVHLVEDENPRRKIEAHGKELDFKILVNDMSL